MIDQGPPGSPADTGTRTSRRRFLALAGAGTAAALLGQESFGQAATLPVLRVADGATVSNGVQAFRSRTDLQPPQVIIDTPSRGPLGGLVITEVHGGASQAGPLLIDQTGRIIWFLPLSPTQDSAHRAFNVQVARYQGEPVLAWFAGAVVAGHGQGSYTLVDSRYRQIAQVTAQNGYVGDLHEFFITPQGTALFTCYAQASTTVTYRGRALTVPYWYGVVQEVDLATGKLLFQWRSDRHIPFLESYIAPTVHLGGAWDYLHLNSIAIDPTDNNLVISGRNTWTVYKINRKNGKVMWRLGGKRSQFHIGSGAHFAFQHDVKLYPGGVMTVFDNEGGPPREGPQSRALLLSLDERRRRVKLIRADVHNPKVNSNALGSVQTLGGGSLFVGWGQSSYFTKYDRSGRVLFDGHLATGGAAGGFSYRAFLQQWQGRPTAPPDVAIVRSGGNATVYASWNGSTGVARWVVNGGPTPSQMTPLGTAAVAGFETAIGVTGAPHCISVSAADRKNRVLATSQVVTS